MQWVSSGIVIFFLSTLAILEPYMGELHSVVLKNAKIEDILLIKADNIQMVLAFEVLITDMLVQYLQKSK